MTQKSLPQRSLADDADLQDGSVTLRKTLALQEIKKKVERNMFFTMKFKLPALHQLGSLLAAPVNKEPDQLALNLASQEACPSGSGDRLRLVRTLPELGDTQPLAQLLSGGGDALATEFVVGSVTHQQPSRFHRTRVEGEAPLAGMWSIQLHSILRVDMERRDLHVSLRAASLGAMTSHASPLSLNLNQLSLSDLLELYAWDMDDSSLLHYFDHQFMSETPKESRNDFTDALALLMKATEGLTLTPSVTPGVAEALDFFGKSGDVEWPSLETDRCRA